MYWAFTTLATVGYGDISAKTVAERVYAIFAQARATRRQTPPRVFPHHVAEGTARSRGSQQANPPQPQIVGGFVFSAVIGQIGQTIRAIDPSEAAKKDKIEEIQSYIREKAFPKKLRKKIMAFYRRAERSVWDERSILQEVPRDIRAEILLHNYSQCVQHISFFYACPAEFVHRLCARVVAVQLHDGISAFGARDASTEVFAIIKGEVEILEGEFDTAHVALLPGAIFGEGAMFQEGPRRCTARSSKDTTLLRWSAAELALLLQDQKHILDEIQLCHQLRCRALERHADLLRARREPPQSAPKSSAPQPRPRHATPLSARSKRRPPSRPTQTARAARPAGGRGGGQGVREVPQAADAPGPARAAGAAHLAVALLGVAPEGRPQVARGPDPTGARASGVGCRPRTAPPLHPASPEGGRAQRVPLARLPLSPGVGDSRRRRRHGVFRRQPVPPAEGAFFRPGTRRAPLGGAPPQPKTADGG